MNGSAVKYWLAVLLLLLASYAGYSGWRLYRSSAEPAAPVAATDGLYGGTVGPFTLTERSGREFSSEELEGDVWVASFFFSSCAGACLQMNNTVSELQEELADTPVRFVSITVDPDTDTPEELRKYADHFHADPQRWLFLTGDEQTIRRLAADFKVAYQQSLHSDRLMLVDGQGRVQGAFRVTETGQRELLRRKIDSLIDAT